MCFDGHSDPASMAHAAVSPSSHSCGAGIKGALNIVVGSGLFSLNQRSPVSPSPSDHSSSSSPTTPVDMDILDPRIALPEPADDDCWNLIPYHIPWGPEYYKYQAGTLPGPDGKTCIFLRSPTPLKNRRTEKACNKCRERKAKCSGTQPACARCVSRGYICTYVSETKRSRGPTLTRERRREKSARDASPRSSDADAWSTTPSSSRFGSPTSSCSRPFSPKSEEADDIAFSPQIPYPEHEYEPKYEIDYWDVPAEDTAMRWAEAAAAYHPANEDASFAPASLPDAYGYPYEAYEAFIASDAVSPDMVAPSFASSPPSPLSVHAPRPVKPMMPLLAPSVPMEHEFDEFGLHVHANALHPDPAAFMDVSFADPVGRCAPYETFEPLHLSHEAQYMEAYPQQLDPLTQQHYEMTLAAVYTHDAHGAFDAYPVSLMA